MTIWQTVDDWVYEYFELDTPQTEFGKFEPMVDLWNSKRINSNLPAWSDFDFSEYKGWHEKISNSTIFYDPFEYKIDFFGFDFITLVGGDWTGYTGTRVIAESEDNDLDMYFYDMMCTQCYISRVSGSLQVEGRGHVKAEIIELPLSDDGKTVTHTIEFTL